MSIFIEHDNYSHLLCCSLRTANVFKIAHLLQNLEDAHFVLHYTFNTKNAHQSKLNCNSKSEQIT